MHDAINLIERGIPAVAVITEPFVPTVRAIQATRKVQEPRFVVMPHPLANLTPEEAAERAEQLLDPVAERLLRALGQLRVAQSG
ncbi:MAG: hypothetical protein N0A24_10875 [Armatimonadetes bacterium]|nr:hypothetical protein [Armatimonadota bacterium]MDW8154678.1 hypothetical protein [Armatimonadota bacterium]